MEKVRPWCGQPSDRGRLMNRTELAVGAPESRRPQFTPIAVRCSWRWWAWSWFAWLVWRSTALYTAATEYQACQRCHDPCSRSFKPRAQHISWTKWPVQVDPVSAVTRSVNWSRASESQPILRVDWLQTLQRNWVAQFPTRMYFQWDWSSRPAVQYGSWVVNEA